MEICEERRGPWKLTGGGQLIGSVDSDIVLLRVNTGSVSDDLFAVPRECLFALGATISDTSKC